MDKFTAQDFIEKISRIRLLRSKDAVFNEVCENYEEIAGCIEEMKLEQTKITKNEMNDFNDTLSALRREINQFLINAQN